MSRTKKILSVCLVISILSLIVSVVSAIVDITAGDRQFTEFIAPVLATTSATVCILIALLSANKKDSKKNKF